MGFLVLVGLALPAMPQLPLNSLVARVDQPRGPIPAECEQGIAPAAPLRVQPRELDLPTVEPAEPIAPPSGALRAALEETQLALTRNDRPAFNAALARTKALLLTYPTGGERRTAEDIVRMHDAAARLWDTQYESPFFSESDPEFALVRELPGYAEAVRRSTLTDDRDRRFYPTAESRDFVAQVAAERLTRLGIRRATTPRATSTRASATEEPVRTPRRRTTTASAGTTSRPTPRATSRPTQSASSEPRSTRKPAAANPAPRSPNPTAPPTVAAAPAPATTSRPSPAPGDVRGSEPASTTAPDIATETTLPSTPSDAPDGAATGTDLDPDVTDTGAITETTPTAAPTTIGDTAATSTDVIPTVPPTSTQRSIILPAILILVGLGVLIVLFRASK